MCIDCGCGDAANTHDHNHVHDHTHDHGHTHRGPDGKEYRHTHDNDQPEHEHGRKIRVEQDVLSKNNTIAIENRQWLDRHHITALNLMSSPGSGKTTLLEKTLERLPQDCTVAILVGDQETDLDAQRLQGKGSMVKQINTYRSCHLDAAMISRELEAYADAHINILLIENIGNLVCPASFDLGEHFKVAILSVTEGEDKPVKYPVLFNGADVVLITKTDLIPHLDWDMQKCHSYIRKSGSRARIIELSARSGEGMDAWIDYLQTTKRHD
jgi:hydrogenase nickel incorporation protein HypB